MGESEGFDSLKLRSRKIKKPSTSSSRDFGLKELLRSEIGSETETDSEDIFEDSSKNKSESESRVNMANLDVNLALKMIPEFDGCSEGLHRFLSCCDVVHNLVKPTEIDSFLNILKIKLVGPAYEIIRFDKYNDWESLRRALQSQFTSKRSLESIQVELNCIRQGALEDIKTFSNRIEVLLYQLNGACLGESNVESVKDIRNLNGRMALRAFQEGLREPIKLLVKACRFTTLKEGIGKALEEESVLKYSIGNSDKVISSDIKPGSTNPILKCQLCNKIGHKASNCFKLGSFNNSTKSFVNSSNTRQTPNNSICSYCHNKGHHIQNCMKRQYNESKRLEEQKSISSSAIKSGNL